MKKDLAILKEFDYNFAILNCKCTAKSENSRIDTNRVLSRTRSDTELGFC